MELVSKDIFLRNIIDGDASILLKWENNVENWEVSDTKQPYTIDEIRQFVQLPQDINFNNQLRLIICEKNNGKPIGCIDLFDFNIGESVGVGILIADKINRNKGFATQALNLVINYCRNELQLAYIFCNIFANNKSSIRLFEKCNFQFVEERMLNHLKVNYYEIRLT